MLKVYEEFANGFSLMKPTSDSQFWSRPTTRPSRSPWTAPGSQGPSPTSSQACSGPLGSSSRTLGSIRLTSSIWSTCSGADFKAIWWSFFASCRRRWLKVITLSGHSHRRRSKICSTNSFLQILNLKTPYRPYLFIFLLF